MQISKGERVETALKFLAYKVVLFIHMVKCTTEGFVDSHSDVKVSNVFPLLWA